MLVLYRDIAATYDELAFTPWFSEVLVEIREAGGRMVLMLILKRILIPTLILTNNT